MRAPASAGTGPVSRGAHGSIALVTIDHPPVNALAAPVRAGLAAAIAAAEADPAMTAIVILCAGRTFVAGGDITEFAAAPKEPHLPDVLARIEAASKPVVAALHGTVLGGGLELALASHGRIAAPGTRFGLPEVKLGLVPGAGGTQRLPRLIGRPEALTLILGGGMIDTAKALAVGLIDQVAEGDLIAAATAHARSLVGRPLRRAGSLPLPPADHGEIARVAAPLIAKARGQIAPGEAERLVTLAGERPLIEGLAEERATFLRLKDGDQSRALRHLFFAEREAGRVPALAGVSPRPVRTVGVVGLGTMGAGITSACLDAGLAVIGIETSEAAAAAGAARITALDTRALKSGRLTEAGLAERRARLTVATDLAALATADLVIEAVFEDMAVKRDLLGRLERVLRPGAIIATNTSYLDVDAMADALAEPTRLVGLHFFSPANVMRLLEVVRAARTAPDVLATALAFGRSLKKIAIVAGVCDGFIGNRIYARYRAQCEFILEEGASPEAIDAALEAYGFAMGPFAVQDLSGLDIAYARRQRLAATRGPDERHVPLLERLVEAGRLGQKAGRGWYRYQDGKRVIDPEVTALIAAHRAERGITPRALDAEEIQTRALATLANEAARVLEDGVAARASDIDLAFVHGYGFPAWRGGPLFAAVSAGLAPMVTLLDQRAGPDGAGFAVSARLRRAAALAEPYAALSSG
jgi:3-hydroxyacyl-CoA dehydrogenase